MTNQENIRKYILSLVVAILIFFFLGNNLTHACDACASQSRFAYQFYRLMEGPDLESIWENPASPLWQWKDVYFTDDVSIKRKIFDSLLNAGLEGNIYALAMAAVVTRNEPDHAQWGQVHTIIEPWLIRQLGEGEANFLLGVFNLYRLVIIPSGRHHFDPNHEGLKQAETYLKQAASAAYPKAFSFIIIFDVDDDAHFTPHKGKEPQDHLPDDIVGKNRQTFYWYLRASEAGSAEASFGLYTALLYSASNSEGKHHPKALYYLEKAAQQGSANAARIYAEKLQHGDFNLSIEKNCKKALLYRALHEKFYRYHLNTVEKYGQWYMHGNAKKDIGICLTKKDHDAALDEADKIYERILLRKKEQDAFTNQLYEKARRALPELKAALNKKN